MARFDKFFRFLRHTLQTIRNNASLHAAMRINVQSAPYGGLSVGSTNHHLFEQKIPSDQLYSFIRMAKIPSSLIWRVFEKFIHLSGPIFPILTSSNLLRRIYSTSYTREFLRTILSNGAQALSENKPLMIGSTPCLHIRIYAISKRASHQSLSGPERNTKRCKRSSWAS